MYHLSSLVTCISRVGILTLPSLRYTDLPALHLTWVYSRPLSLIFPFIFSLVISSYLNLINCPFSLLINVSLFPRHIPLGMQIFLPVTSPESLFLSHYTLSSIIFPPAISNYPHFIKCRFFVAFISLVLPPQTDLAASRPGILFHCQPSHLPFLYLSNLPPLQIDYSYRRYYHLTTAWGHNSIC